MQAGEPSACVWPQPAATEVLSPLSLTSFTEQAATRQLERLAGFRESVPMPRLPTAEATLAVPAPGDVALSGRALTDAGALAPAAVFPGSQKKTRLWESGGLNPNPPFVQLWSCSKSRQLSESRIYVL